MASAQYRALPLIRIRDLPQSSLLVELGPVKQAACFSICNERLEVDSTAALRYFARPRPHINLRDGLEPFLNLPLEDRVFYRARRLDDIFTICLSSKNSEELLKADVVTWRGIMNRIMRGDPIDLNISYYRGVLYLEEESIHGKFDEDSEGTYMGHRFEAFSTAATPGGEPDSDGVDLHTMWNVAITRKLGSLNLLLVGEVDCVKEGYSKNPGPENYVELKTKKLGAEKTVENQNFPNLGKWYMQSYLLGTPEIFVGFRNAEGIVHDFRTLTVPPITESEPARKKVLWGAQALHSLRRYCALSPMEGGTLKVWRVQARFRSMEIRELSTEEVEQLNEGGLPRNGIIPLSFLGGLEQRMFDDA
ncbi:hypothetical protein C8R43DRAFT_1004383 [Mycena crocata]|nr:hypothetical protein C8R43DRAFT_1004383 [Mycena crocata]